MSLLCENCEVELKGAVTEGRKGLTEVEVKHLWAVLRAHGSRTL